MALDWLGCRLLLNRMQATYETWRQSVESQGWHVESGTPAGGGFPFGATLKIPSLALSGGQALVPGGLDWHAQRVMLIVSLLHPFRLAVAPQGQQVIRAAGGQTVVLNADELMAQVPLGRGKPDHIRIVASDVTAGLQKSGNPQDVRIAWMELQLEAARGDAARTSLALEIKARGVGLPDKGRWPLGATITRLEADISLASPALSGQAPAEQARAWRDWGGKLNVSRLALKWGPLDMTGSALLGLDKTLQPAGTGQAQMRGWAAALDALANGGTLPVGVAQTAKAMLGLMVSVPGENGGEPAVTLPMTLKDSQVSVGSIPLLRLRPVRWGGV